LGAEGDEKVNLFCEDGHWMVTTIERGAQRQFEAQYNDIDAASVKFFNKLSGSRFTIKQMNRYYTKNKSAIPDFKKNCIHETIKNTLTKIASY
jgi:hypothetical protein